MCVKIRISFLNQLTPEQIGGIMSRFVGAMLVMGTAFDKQKMMNNIKSHYAKAA